jgi:hypothetical protein
MYWKASDRSAVEMSIKPDMERATLRVLPPATTDSEDLAMTLLAGMPPSTPQAMLAAPWPTSSWLGSNPRLALASLSTAPQESKLSSEPMPYCTY